MALSPEIFVLAVFVVGYPFFYLILRDSDLKGRHFFMAAYTFLTLSNIFTVVEDFRLYDLFNACEHLSITIGAIMMLVAVIQLAGRDSHKTIHVRSDDPKV